MALGTKLFLNPQTSQAHPEPKGNEKVAKHLETRSILVDHIASAYPAELLRHHQKVCQLPGKLIVHDCAKRESM